MQRIARALGADPEDPAAWCRVPWERLTYAETNVIRAWVIARQKPAGARLTLSILKGVLRAAFRLGLMTSANYLRAVEVGRVNGTSAPAGRMVQADEVEALYTHCDSLPRGRREMLRALLSCGFGGGLRRQELASLRTDAFDGSALRFVGKGNKEATQPLPKWACTDVGAWLALRSKARPPFRVVTLFVVFREGQDPEDLAMSGRQVWETIDALADAAGVEHFAPHDMRRTFISRMLEMDVGVAKTLARHANVQTTLTYDRRGEKAADAALSELKRF
jgi:integrase